MAYSYIVIIEKVKLTSSDTALLYYMNSGCDLVTHHMVSWTFMIPYDGV